MSRPNAAQALIDRLVMLLRADPTRPLGDAMRIAGWADSTAKAQQSRVKALPEVQTALADQRAMLRAAVLAEYPIADIAKRRVELAKQDESVSTALTATDRLLEDIGAREKQDQQQVIVMVVQQIAPILIKFVPEERHGELAQAIQAYGEQAHSDTFMAAKRF